MKQRQGEIGGLRERQGHDMEGLWGQAEIGGQREAGSRLGGRVMEAGRDRRQRERQGHDMRGYGDRER
jgi:hypothetical protein